MNRAEPYFCGVKIGLALVVSFIALFSYGQRKIVDDSTRQVYGPETVEVTNEYRIKNNLDRYTMIDTTVYQGEKYNLEDKFNRRYQSLGFLGTPFFNHQYDLTSHPGRTFGFSGYDLYFKKIEEINYYDTKSPFMDMFLILGGQSRSTIDFSFTRNVNPHWNLGFDIDRITADKQIALESQGDRQTESSAFDIYTHYFNEERPYELAFSYTTIQHNVADLGGVKVPADPTTPDYYLYEDATTLLADAKTLDKRSRIHLYQQYRLASGFQVYTQHDLITQEYKFSDEAGSDDYLTFYPRYLDDDGDTFERNTYREFTNEVGLKGDIGGTFYRFYLKRRSLIYDPKFALETTKGETYAGTYLRLDLDDKTSISAKGELSNEGAYQVSGQISSPLFEGSYTSQRALQSFLVQSFSGNHHSWSNNFAPTFSNKITGRLILDWRGIELRPEVSLLARSNLVIFNLAQEPEQMGKTHLINRYGGTMAMSFLKGFGFLGMHDQEYFRLETEAFIQDDSGPQDYFIKAPGFKFNGRLFWRGEWFQNAVPVEIGINAWFRSAYYGNAYDPVLSVFYAQNDLELEEYWALDAFINMKIRNLRAYMKFVHINQQLNDGYMTTPLFPGQKSIFDLGIQWLFFD